MLYYRVRGGVRNPGRSFTPVQGAEEFLSPPHPSDTHTDIHIMQPIPQMCDTIDSLECELPGPALFTCSVLAVFPAVYIHV
ncbi:hypothetical protein XELAEV_18000415mg [Xenopus laevis]|uniref:Uncharacterized protein n=1 Tax=Xenopus laevis TaxID=8355 RepID=A0A974GYJ8_XENLA|nr:hypothetical protein XELAEV_18000415mg [Xenopus laevis]